MVGERSLKGAVTWQTIAQALHVGEPTRVAEALIEVPIYSLETELIDAIPALLKFDFVFVKERSNRPIGIVTSADVVAAYGEMATPFFLIGELDRLLRRLVVENFAIERVATVCDPDGRRMLESFDDLGMGDYQRLLEQRDLWESLDWPLDRSTLLRRLDEIREIRNDLMHFNPDPIPNGAVEQVRNMIKILRKYS